MILGASRSVHADGLERAQALPGHAIGSRINRKPLRGVGHVLWPRYPQGLDKENPDWGDLVIRPFSIRDVGILKAARVPGIGV